MDTQPPKPHDFSAWNPAWLLRQMEGNPVRSGTGFTLIELIVVVAIIGILAAIAIPNLLDSQRRTRYSKAASETKTATSNAILYGVDKGKYPASLVVLRDAGYPNVSSTDPWGVDYQLSPVLLGELPAGVYDDVYIYSMGSSMVSTYPVPFVTDTGPGGSVGYSSIYGAWIGN